MEAKRSRYVEPVLYIFLLLLFFMRERLDFITDVDLFTMFVWLCVICSAGVWRAGTLHTWACQRSHPNAVPIHIEHVGGRCRCSGHFSHSHIWIWAASSAIALFSFLFFGWHLTVMYCILMCLVALDCFIKWRWIGMTTRGSSLFKCDEANDCDRRMLLEVDIDCYGAKAIRIATVGRVRPQR